MQVHPSIAEDDTGQGQEVAGVVRTHVGGGLGSHRGEEEWVGGGWQSAGGGMLLKLWWCANDAVKAEWRRQTGALVSCHSHRQYAAVNVDLPAPT